MRQINYIQKSIALDVVFLGGIRLPGYCTTDSKGFDSTYSISPAPGTEGAYIRYTGYQPSEFTIKCQMYDFSQLAIFEPIEKKYRPKAGKKNPEPLDFYNYLLTDRWGIKKVLIKKITPSIKNGIYTATIDCVEYFKPPKISRAKVMSGQPNVMTGTPASPAPVATVTPPSALARSPK